MDINQINKPMKDDVYEGEVETVWIGDDGEDVPGVLLYTATRVPITGELSIKLTGGYATANSIAAMYSVNETYIHYIINDSQYNSEYISEALDDAKAYFAEEL